jgi:hypothetical protein
MKKVSALFGFWTQESPAPFCLDPRLEPEDVAFLAAAQLFGFASLVPAFSPISELI